MSEKKYPKYAWRAYHHWRESLKPELSGVKLERFLEAQVVTHQVSKRVMRVKHERAGR